MQRRDFTKSNLEHIKASFNTKAGITPKKKYSTSRILLTAALAVCFTIGALASTNIIDMSGIYSEFLGMGSEDAGFTINRTFEADGIELKLLSAVADGNMGYIFFTLQDLSGGRLDANIGWGWNAADFHGGWFKGDLLGGSIDVLSYDDNSETITAVMQVRATKGISANDKITFKIGRLESGLVHYDDYDTSIDLYSLVSGNTDFQTTNEYSSEINSWGYLTEMEHIFTEKKIREMTLLQKNVLNMSIPEIDWSVISNIGFIDGNLHIQYKSTENRRFFNMGSFALYDQNGNEINDMCTINFGDYTEFIYDNINTPEALKNISLKADFTTSKIFIDENWRLDFKVDSQVQEKKITIKSPDFTGITEIIVESSPIGTTVRYKAEDYHYANDIFKEGNYLKLKDDTHIPLTMYSMMFDHEKYRGDVNYKNTFFDIEHVNSIVISGTEYLF